MAERLLKHCLQSLILRCQERDTGVYIFHVQLMPKIFPLSVNMQAKYKMFDSKNSKIRKGTEFFLSHRIMSYGEHLQESLVG